MTMDLALWCQSRMEEGGIVPPHSVLAPGTTLELLLSRALPFAQVQGIVAVRMMMTSRKLTNQKGDIDEGRFGRLFDPSCPRHSLRSLPFGPTRGGPWMQRLQPEMVEASQHDAVNGVALTVRNSHLINPRLPLHGRAAHDCRERYLAKEWFGSNRVGQERLQLPVATTTETNPKKNANDDCMRLCDQRPKRNRRLRHALPLRTNPGPTQKKIIFNLTALSGKVRPTAALSSAGQLVAF